MKLISMTDFVLEIAEQDFRHKHKDQVYQQAFKMVSIIQYANFLNQPLTLGMFVPCGEDGNVLEEPNEKDEQFYGAYGISNLNKAKNKYKAAKYRVLFEGFEVVNQELLYKHEENCYDFLSIPIQKECTIEFACTLLQGVEPTLTKSALKQLGL